MVGQKCETMKSPRKWLRDKERKKDTHRKGWSETGRWRAWKLASGKDPVWVVCDAIHTQHLLGDCSSQLTMPLCLYNSLMVTNVD